ncbi:MAG: AAA family ATPase [Nitrospirae bacterium]|nr:AAA family ATPase [Nitrospirota bacterium]
MLVIEKLILNKFTAFESLELEFSDGINIFIGENDTGKTHILKVIYCACDITTSKKSFTEKLTKVFLSADGVYPRLATGCSFVQYEKCQSAWKVFSSRTLLNESV